MKEVVTQGDVEEEAGRGEGRRTGNLHVLKSAALDDAKPRCSS